MSTAAHDGIVSLFQNHPALAVELLERGGGVRLGGTVRASLASEAAPQVDPVTLAADAVVLLGGAPPNDQPTCAVLVEVQLRPDARKRYSWPFYIVSHRRTLRCPVWLLVVTTKESVARWAAKPIPMGHHDFTLKPIVLGPSTMPVITDPAEAARHPELAVLSALAHARDDAAVPTAIAALGALGSVVDDDARRRYNDVVFGSLNRELEKAVTEALMQQGHYEFQSRWAKRHIAEGRAEGRAEGEAKGKAEGEAKGRAEGEAKGKAEAILAFLAGRGIAVSADASEKILSCRDIATLDPMGGSSGHREQRGGSPLGLSTDGDAPLAAATLNPAAPPSRSWFLGRSPARAERHTACFSPLMSTAAHDGIVSLFQNHPALAVELLERGGGVRLGGTVRASLASEAAPQVDPVTLAADAVVLLGGAPPNDKPTCAVLVEVQLRPDARKRYSWPFYIVSHRRTLRCPVWLLVVTTKESVARWAAKPIPMGHHDFTLKPIVLGPSTMPVVTDPAEAARHPELAVLSALAHARDDAAVPTAIAALGALGSVVDDDARRRYNDVVFGSLNRELEKAVTEALMQQGHYEFQSRWAKRHIAEGEAKGRAEGEAKGKAEAILAFLAGRGIAVSAVASEKILSCRDIATLDRWVARAGTASTVEDVLSA